MTKDLLYQDEIKAIVRNAYSTIPAGAGDALARRLYSPTELAQLPAGAVRWALGVGNPVRHAQLRSGEVVLDVGSGGGIDTILAARRVGPTGRAIGLDLLEEMCTRARANAASVRVDGWVEFRQGEMERIPLPDASVDVVVSNGVINLSPRKSRTVQEIYRVLRPGGRLAVADLTVEDDLPPAVLASGAAWAGCVAGAMSERVFANKLRTAGFADIRLDQRTPFGIDDVALYPLFTAELIALMRRLVPAESHAQIAWSVLATARKPG
jgi:SAM-dependent methyltransferase